MWIWDCLHYQVLGVPLYIICCCGLVGIFIDIDHSISHYLCGRLHPQFLHEPLFISSCVVFCCLGAYLGGLVLGVVLAPGKG